MDKKISLFKERNERVFVFQSLFRINQHFLSIKIENVNHKNFKIGKINDKI